MTEDPHILYSVQNGVARRAWHAGPGDTFILPPKAFGEKREPV